MGKDKGMQEPFSRYLLKKEGIGGELKLRLTIGKDGKRDAALYFVCQETIDEIHYRLNPDIRHLEL